MQPINELSVEAVQQAAFNLSVPLTSVEASYFMKLLDQDTQDTPEHLLLSEPHFLEIKEIDSTRAQAIVDEAIYKYKFIHPDTTYESFAELAPLLVSYCADVIPYDIFTKMKIKTAVDLLTKKYSQS